MMKNIEMDGKGGNMREPLTCTFLLFAHILSLSVMLPPGGWLTECIT